MRTPTYQLFHPLRSKEFRQSFLFGHVGSYVTPPDWAESGDESDDTAAKLGDLLSGRLSEVDVDSVTTVHERPASD